MQCSNSYHPMEKINAYRGSILHFLRAPRERQDHRCYQYFQDGLLVVEGERIAQIGNYQDLKSQLDSAVKIIDYSGKLLMPGFIDTHIHYPQTGMIASYGEQLLEWLNCYVFPEEKKFVDSVYAEKIAKFFLHELLRNGTTTCVAYSTVHPGSADILFNTAKELNMCVLTGKTLMDRNAPAYLLDTPEKAYSESKKLIEKWHGQGRARYVITPRFAPTSTSEQLEVAAKLRKDFPTTYLQTHLSENRNEVQWVRELYPNNQDYAAIYEHYNFLGPRSIFGHVIHVVDREFQALAESKSVIAWCPTSNFFLGSGLFQLDDARKFNTRLSIATDVGGGSSFSMLRTLSAAYKVAALQGSHLSPLESFYRITLGNAEALSLDEELGNLLPQKYADFLVVDLHSTPLLSLKTDRAVDLEEVLFNLSILGDDRAIDAVYIAGMLQHKR